VTGLEVVGWLTLVPMLALCVTQWFGFTGMRSIAALQALSLFVLAPAAVVALAAVLTGRHALALVALVPLATLMWLTTPVVFHGSPGTPAEGSPRVTIAYANFLASNPDPAAGVAALAATGADVLVLVEFTPELAELLDRAVGDGDYPHRYQQLHASPSGIGLWSRLQITDGGVTTIGSRVSVDVVIDVGGVGTRVVALHPFPPTFNASGWEDELRAIGDHTANSPLPTLLVGDFNGSRWHPPFRDLLDHGWSDAHEQLGHGFSASWPMDEGWLPPPFVRLDHALYNDGVVPVRITDVTIPGSDHLGFVADYGFSRPAGQQAGQPAG